ncbi:hypothetical protein ACT9SR_13110, partial [Enterococcus faecalis]|uniref:hypothetical protein n=1 Tax=Enterococcus faecalis TaxID=1351 RepID=UPI00403A3152
FSFGTSATVKPGLGWNRVELASRPKLAQSVALGTIGGLALQGLSVPARGRAGLRRGAALAWAEAAGAAAP